MCVAVPGKVISIQDTTAMADFSGNVIPVETGLVRVKIGDYVLVHAGCVIQVLTQSDHDAICDLFEELKDLSDE